MAPTSDLSSSEPAAVRPRCKHENDWHSPDSVRDWRARDAGRAEERDRWLRRLIAAVPFDTDDVLRVLDVAAATAR
jgi:hypothetical protein